MAHMRFRKHLLVTAAAILSLLAFATLAGAQQQPSPLKVTKIKDNVYWAQGGVGSNDGIIIGTTGVIVVDTKTTPDSEGSYRRNRQNHSQSSEYGHHHP